jgi:integrase
MGSVNIRNGKIFFDFRYRGKRCREQTKLHDTPANQKRAKKIMERIEAEILLGTFDYKTYFPNSKKLETFLAIEKNKTKNPENVPTFKEFSETWFLENEVTWRSSHKNAVRGTLDRRLVPEFGESLVNQISKADILAFRARISKLPGRAGNTTWSAEHINHTMTPLRQILNEAADRFEFVSPYRGIKSLKVPRTDVDPFTLEEVQLIINNVRPDYKNYYITRFFTGMRSAEINGLMWKYVDFERKQVLIRETFVNNEITTTKTDGSQREILMSAPVYEALKQQESLTGKSTFVFSNTEGLPKDNNNITKRVWYPLLRLLNLKKRRPYQSRHTAATLWLASGENPEWIARQLGHSTTEMLFRVYSRYVPNITRNDGSAFDRLLSNTISHKNIDKDPKGA